MFKFLIVDGSVRAHRLILGSASKFLRQILTESSDDEETVILLPDVQQVVLLAVMDFLYTVSLSPNSLINSVYIFVLLSISVQMCVAVFFCLSNHLSDCLYASLSSSAYLFICLPDLFLF